MGHGGQFFPTAMKTEEQGEQFEALVQNWPMRFERGVSDCCAFAARWAEVVCGILPGADILDDAPFSDKEALLVLARFGGLARLVEISWEEAGWKPVIEPQDGDVVVCEAETALGGETVGVWRRGRCVSVNEQGGFDLWTTKPKAIWRWDSARQS